MRRELLHKIKVSYLGTLASDKDEVIENVARVMCRFKVQKFRFQKEESTVHISIDPQFKRVQDQHDFGEAMRRIFSGLPLQGFDIKLPKEMLNDDSEFEIRS